LPRRTALSSSSPPAPRSSSSVTTCQRRRPPCPSPNEETPPVYHARCSGRHVASTSTRPCRNAARHNCRATVTPWSSAPTQPRGRDGPLSCGWLRRWLADPSASDRPVPWRASRVSVPPPRLGLCMPFHGMASPAAVSMT
jgi:hypothetical protein